MLDRKKEKKYVGASIDITIFDDADVISTSLTESSPDTPEEDLGMWT